MKIGFLGYAFQVDWLGDFKKLSAATSPYVIPQSNELNCMLLLYMVLVKIR